MWRPLALILLITLVVAPVRAQEPTPTATDEAPVILSTVTGTPITAAEFQTRYLLEGHLLLQQLTAFAQSYVTQDDPGSTPVREVLNLAYPAQAAALRDPARLGETVLNSMEADILLRQRADDMGLSVMDEQVDVLVVYQVALTDGFVLGDDATLSDEETAAFAAAVEAFYEAAAAFANTDRATVRELFRGRALRRMFFDQVTANVDITGLTQIEANARQNAVFQQWALDLREAAAITRSDDWQTHIPTQPDFAARLEDALTRITPDTAR
jgi:hypothetical protein